MRQIGLFAEPPPRGPLGEATLPETVRTLAPRCAPASVVAPAERVVEELGA